MLVLQFQDWLDNMNIKSNQKVLCAISGGVDSMVMLNLFIKSMLNIEVAHINYNLRSEDSKLDQKLVENVCHNNNIVFHTINKNKPEGARTQEWAREIRFQFFKDLDDVHSYDFIALAHHTGDQLETILLSIFKGYSIQSIASIRDKFIRPLLEIDKAHILDYASANDIEFRNDLSNSSTDYDRNFIRLEVVPKLEKRFPNFKNRVIKFAERQKKDKQLLDKMIANKVSKYTEKQYNNLGNYSYLKYSLEILKEADGKEIILKYLESKYGFSKTQISNLLESDSPSAEIQSKKHLAQKNKVAIYVGTIRTEELNLQISKNQIPFELHRFKINRQTEIKDKASVLQLSVDENKCKLPLSLRKVKMTESFGSFGLKGQNTEVGKFLKKLEIPSFFRSQEYLLIDSENHIIIPGMEIDYGLRLDNTSKTAIIIDIEDKSDHIITETYKE